MGVGYLIAYIKVNIGDDYDAGIVSAEI